MNTTKFYFQCILNNIISMCLTGAVIQTFFMEKGIGENDVNVFLSIMQIIQVLTIFLFMKKSDSCKNVIRVTAFVYLLNVPLTAFLIILSFFSESKNVYVLMYLTGMVSNICFGINNVLSYKLPYYIMDMKQYGKLLSISGIIIGVTSTLFSLLLSFMQKSFGYFQAMKIIYLAVLLMVFSYTVITNSFKNVYVEREKEENKRISILKYKPFLYLIVPNILRGFSLGMINIIVTVGYFVGLIDSFSSSILIVITNVITVLGCFAYSRSVNKIKEKNLLLFSSIAVTVLMPLIVIGNTVTFLIFYAFAFFFVIIINYGVPVTVTKICNEKVMGQYSAGRMLLNTLGTSLAGFLCVPMIELFGAFLTMLICGVFQLLSGLGYYFYIVKEGFYEDNL